MTTNEYIQFTLDLNVGELSKDGALMVKTGASTGRSTKERFVVRHPELESEISWGPVNKPVTPEFGDQFFARLEEKLQDQKLYGMEGYVGCFRVKVRSTSPWHIAFAQNMFRETVVEQLKNHVQDNVVIEILHDPYGQVSELRLEHEFEKAIIVDPKKLKVGIIGTAYAGEIKKSAFSLCNYLFPKYGIFPMHASANCLADGSNSSVLFGLSGTGKTTLSADPSRFLIGDDEIVWSESGISTLKVDAMQSLSI
ncbi:MAG: phosphoenolpyruvate carboxykinase (ATP) [Bdellovibrionales bacterium]